MDIEAKYVSFENAKLLKEKGFDVEEPCTCGGYPECICEISKASIPNYVYRPEHWVVIEWLRIKHNLWLIATIPTKTTWYYKIDSTNELVTIAIKSGFNTPSEAIEVGITHILTNLI